MVWSTNIRIGYQICQFKYPIWLHILNRIFKFDYSLYKIQRDKNLNKRKECCAYNSPPDFNIYLRDDTFEFCARVARTSLKEEIMWTTFKRCHHESYWRLVIVLISHPLWIWVNTYYNDIHFILESYRTTNFALFDDVVDLQDIVVPP